MKSKQIFGALLFGLAGFSTQALAQQNYSFDEIIKLGLANSHQLKITASQQKIDELSVKEAKLAYAPNISVSGQAMALNKPDIRFMGQPSSMTPPNGVAFAMGSLSIPIFNGFQLKNNLKLNQELVLAGAEKGNIDSTVVVVNLIDAYITLYKAQKSQSIIQKNIATAQQRANDFEKMKNNGLLTENDLLKVQLQVSQLELTLLDVNHQAELAQYNLNLLTGLDEGVHFTADSTVIYKIPSLMQEPSLDDLLTNRKDFQALEHQFKASEYGLKIQKSGYYPHVSLTGMYASIYVPNFLTAKNVLNAGISVKWDLSSFYKNNPVVAQKRESLLQVNEQMAQMTDKIKIESHKGFLDLQQTKSKVELYQKMEVQAQENYRTVEQKFDNKLATTSDLLEADVQFLQTQINEQLAQADVFLAYCNYLKVTGNLNALQSIN